MLNPQVNSRANRGGGGGVSLEESRPKEGGGESAHPKRGWVNGDEREREREREKERLTGGVDGARVEVASA